MSIEKEIKHFGMTVDDLDESVLQSYESPNQLVFGEIGRALAMVEGWRGEINRDEIMRTLNRARWILANKLPHR